MIINAAGKFADPLFLVLQEFKEQFGPIVMQDWQKMHSKFVYQVFYNRKVHQTTNR